MRSRLSHKTTSHHHAFWMALLGIALGEMLLAARLPMSGLLLLTLLLGALLLYSGAAIDERARHLALALTLVPLLRLVTLALPLERLPQWAWHPSVALLLGSSVWLIMRATSQTRSSLGLRRGTLVLQFALGQAGLALGAVQYLLAPPTLPLPTTWADTLLLMLSLLLCAGLFEELIFRGLLQNLAPPVLGHWGLIFVSALWAVLQVGYLSLAHVLFAACAALLWAHLAHWGGSIIGVALAHGIASITLLLLLPYLAARQPQMLSGVIGGMLFIGSAALLVVGGILRLQYQLAQPLKPSSALREPHYRQRPTRTTGRLNV